MIEVVLGRERTALLGPLRRAGGGNLRAADLKIIVTYWGGGKGGWKPRAFSGHDGPLETWGEGVWENAWAISTSTTKLSSLTFRKRVEVPAWRLSSAKKILGYRQADRREGNPLSDDERRWFRQIIQRIAALLALSTELNSLYQQAVVEAFTANELGIER